MDQALRIASVVPDSNAARANLERGDILISYAEARVTNGDDLNAAVTRSSDLPGPVLAEIIRGGTIHAVEVATGPLGIYSTETEVDIAAAKSGAAIAGGQITTRPEPPVTRVEVVDINMPFFSMVGFMVKWALASVPAALILGGLVWGVLALFAHK